MKELIVDATVENIERYTTSNVYYVAATNGKVTFTPNQSFVGTLRDKGVISGVHSDATIKIYPVFAQEQVRVNFENTDRDDSKAGTKGKFDRNNTASYILNILEAYEEGNLTKRLHAGWLDYYSMDIPKYSIVRVQTQPISTRVASGVTYWHHSDGIMRTVYYEEGDVRFSGTTSNGELITETDYSRADIVADASMSIKPSTGQQTFDVSYFPHQDIPEAYTGEDGLTNAVVQSSAIENEIIDGGVYRIQNVNSGKYLLNESISAAGNVAQGDLTGDARELWTLMVDDNGYYNLVNGSGYYLDVSSGSSADGANIWTYARNNTNAQDFRLEKQEDGSYAILTRITSDISAVEVAGSSTENDANVQQSAFTGADNQKWTLVLVEAASVGTDAEGKYVFVDPFVGMAWSLTAVAPEGYYTQWVNMTGDTNGDGYISDSEADLVRGRSSMPDEVYGNRLSGQLDQDNFKLYYYFLPKTGGGSGVKTGTVTRAADTFYELAKNIEAIKDPVPVSGAYVDIGGFVGMTDGNGDYEIECSDLPSAGNVSTTITTDGSSSYYTVSKLQRYTPIELPALSKFNAEAVDASYESVSGAIAGEAIVVNDDMLTLSATVLSESAIVPADVRFFVYDANGNERFACEGRDGYTVTTTAGAGELTANLTFNPKQDMQSGYRVYVQFADQNGEWTNVIDLGYYFNAKLDLGEFIFPLIGSSSLEDTITTGFVADIIGNPLGDLEIGAISGFEENNYTYTPSGINKDDARDYTWTRTDYTFGWSQKFGDTKKTTSQQTDEEKLNSYLRSIYDGTSKGAQPPTPSRFSTQSRFRWSVTPSVGFNLTLSSRNNGNAYFEDLVFYVKVDFDTSASQTIQLPVGISILIKAGLGGDVAGIYHMYVDYQDSYETEDAVRYTAEDFGVFKKFENSVRREGYIFPDPYVSVSLGVGVAVVYVKGNARFDFDMDFHFTEAGTYSYGDMTIDLGWGIEVFGFDVYSSSLYDTTVKLFNTEGQDGHIDFDYENAAAASLMSIGDYFTQGDETMVLDRPSSRAYLENRSEWLGAGGVSLMALDGSEGTVEATLRNGTSDVPYVRMAELDNGEVLMVFIDDDETRSDVNKRTLYCSIYNGSEWSEPVIVEDDGTPDDYPTLCDLGDGRIFVAWSSAEEALPDGATVEEALKSANIRAAFFDEETMEMGEVMKITKTTDEDYAADVMPGAAFDPETNRLILYYTKTEYSDLEELTDLSEAYSVNAYMFYDNAAGTWSTADDYTEEELEGIENVEAYKENWYGQRFLDLRINPNSGEMPRVVDSSAISYNGLGMFAWTVDWDGTLDTVDDRDVFMQIYNFSEDSFTHIIRVTSETSAYMSPKFERSNNQTYLFFGAREVDGESGEIRYLNVSSLIRNGKFEKVYEEGGNEYYVFQDVHEAYTVEGPDGEIEEIPAETVLIGAVKAVDCDNPMDYDVKVSEDGQIYLFWTDMTENSRDIMVSVYNGSDTDDEYSETSEGSDETEEIEEPESFWSEPVAITKAGENEFYSGLGAAVVDGNIIVVSAKGDYDDETASSLVCQMHIPFSSIKATELSLDSEYPQPLSEVALTAAVKNEGLATEYASEETPIAVTFTMNGEIIGTYDITSPITGGTTVEAVCSAELPEDISNVEFTAYVDEGETASVTLEQSSNITLENSAIGHYSSRGYDEANIMYSAVVANDGNADAENIVFTATAGETEVGTVTVESLEANSEENVDIILDIPDSAYTIGEDGLGTVEISVEAVSGDQTLASYSGRAQKSFSAEAIALLDSVTDISFQSSRYTMKPGEEEDIQPEISGVEAGSLTVEWQESTDTDVEYINYDNIIVAGDNGTATITGIVVPNEERIEFDSSGNATKVDWKELIPEDKLVTVTATVRVSDGTSSGGSSGGGSITYTVTFETNGGNTVDSVRVNRNGTIANLPVPEREGYVFDGWYTDEALTQPFTEETAVTSALRLYAKWTEEGTQQGTGDGYVNPFKDVAESDWFSDSVRYVYENNLFSGVADDMFAPNGELTRAMLVTVLWRAEGEPQTNYVLPFEDVAEDSYYAEAVRWAASEGVVNGYSETEFAPDDSITREQIAAIMYRYAEIKGNAPEGEWAIQLDYADLEDISDWATEAVMFCKLREIMLGNDNNEFKPLDNATRAEAAAIIERFLKDLNAEN